MPADKQPDAPQQDKPDTTLTDEALAFACSCNDDASYAPLYERYYNPIGYYIRKHSTYQDPSFRDDIREIIFFKTFSRLKQGGFKPQFPGSFKAFLLDVALKTILDENQKRMRVARPISEVFTDEELAEPDELLFREPEDTDYEEIQERAQEVMSRITPEEQRLAQLAFVEGMKYADIIKLKEFKHYKSVDSIKKKIYRIKQKLNPRRGPR